MDPNVATLLASAGRDLAHDGVSVNPPVQRASTFVFRTLGAFEQASKTPFDGPFYGRVGTPTTFAFEQAMARLEGGHRSIACASGLAAITATFLAFLKAGDHCLVVDSVYGPARRLCDRTLARMGVETSYYDPAVGAGIEALLRPNTRLIYLESPGSGTFEVQDVPAIAAVARRHAIPTAIDNTWATPLFFRPLAHGVDVSIQAATKYVVGHSDAMLGVVTTTEAVYPDLRRATQDLGGCAGSEECNLGLRGLRTLDVRLARHHASGITVARWLAGRPEVTRVLHPALPDCVGHALWARDFSGASGLFSCVMAPGFALHAFVDALQHFKIGFSWGGFESLVLPAHPETRQHPRWVEPGPVLRFHVGLEDPSDLVADLGQAFAVAGRQGASA
jgi:cysteine-S-conjugate beta-lyase